MPKVNITRSGLTYDRYIASLQAEKITTQFKGLDFYLDQFNVFRNIINLLPCAVYILDYTTMRYLYMSEYVKVLFGYTAKEMIELGPASQLSRVHPDDLLVFKSTLFNEFINYSKSIPAEDLKDTVFALNIRSQRKDGTYVNFLQQYVVLERDRSNNPLLTLGVATDITAFGKSNGVTFSVSKYTENARAIKVYSPNELDANHHITKREIEVIKYMLQGFTSKEIAVKLHISQYTVKAHRQNIMEKTHCKNAAQLSNYALTNGLI